MKKLSEKTILTIARVCRILVVIYLIPTEFAVMTILDKYIDFPFLFDNDITFDISLYQIIAWPLLFSLGTVLFVIFTKEIDKIRSFLPRS